MNGAEFSYPVLRWLLKGWFFASSALFLYFFWSDVFEVRVFILLWAIFSFVLGVYVAPAIRIDSESLDVKYLWRYRAIPWRRVLAAEQTVFGAQILTADSNWAYRVVGYQVPMPGAAELVAAVRAMRASSVKTAGEGDEA